MSHKHSKWILIFIIIGVVLGFLTGWFFGEEMLAFSWMGKLFLNSLKMLIVPLIMAAVISGISALGDIRKIGRIGYVTIAYYLFTTSIAVIIGLIMVNIIEPGKGLVISSTELPQSIAEKSAVGIEDILMSLVTPNVIDAMGNTKLLPVIMFSIVLAAALTTVGEKGKVVLDFFSGLNEAMMKLVVWLMYFAPIGIFSLISTRLAKAGGADEFLNEVTAVGLHIVTVISGLAIHFLILFSILFVITKRGRKYLTGMLRALFTAFGTASSSATLPLTMECIKEQGVDDKSSKFVVPLGSTINMDGTALYEACAVMFIAQAYGMEMSFYQQVIIFLTATLAAIGAAGIPEAGLVTMVIVLEAVGIPLDGIALLLAVDWFLDRFRTTVNVWGDAVGAAIVERMK